MRDTVCKKVCLRSVSLLLVMVTPLVTAQDNSYRKRNSGKWEKPSNWSLGFAPTNSHPVFITNAFPKVVTIALRGQ